jgi:hypothetical protein
MLAAGGGYAMKQPAKNRTVARGNERIVRELEALAESVRRRPELHHDNADRLLVLAERLRAQAAPAGAKRPAERAAATRR